MKVTVTYRNVFVRRLVKVTAVGLVFLAGLGVGNVSAHYEGTKACHSVSYDQGEYKRDLVTYGQKVASYNEGFADASRCR